MAVKLLIATIGNYGPVTVRGSSGPLRAAQELGPTQLILISNETLVDQHQAWRDRLDEDGLPQPTFLTLQLDANPANLDRAMMSVGDIRKDLSTLAVGLRAHEIAVCATGSTPQIRTAVTLALLSWFPGAQHYECPDTGAVTKVETPDLFTHRTELTQAYELLWNCRFDAASQLFARRLSKSTTVALAERPITILAKAVSDSLQLANQLNPGEGYAKLVRAQSDSPCRAEVEPLVQHFAALQRGAQGQTQPGWVAEVAAASMRQFVEGREAESVIYAAMALEVGLTWVLQQAHVDKRRLTQAQMTVLSSSGRTRAFTQRPNQDWGEIRGGGGALSEAARSFSTQYANWFHSEEQSVNALQRTRDYIIHNAAQGTHMTPADSHALLGRFCDSLMNIRVGELPSAPAQVQTLALRLSALSERTHRA